MSMCECERVSQSLNDELTSIYVYFPTDTPNSFRIRNQRHTIANSTEFCAENSNNHFRYEYAFTYAVIA